MLFRHPLTMLPHSTAAAPWRSRLMVSLPHRGLNLSSPYRIIYDSIDNLAFWLLKLQLVSLWTLQTTFIMNKGLVGMFYGNKSPILTVLPDYKSRTKLKKKKQNK